MKQAGGMRVVDQTINLFINIKSLIINTYYKMRSKDIEELLVFAIANRLPILIKGAPGIGKTSIVKQASARASADLQISHPVVSDPTDYKGLPFVVNDRAEFLPFGDLRALIEATKPTVFFLDDLGQAPASVQAACMQLLLERRINGHHVSDYVTFIAATNRREDKAAVGGLLEPVKSRFASIVELEFNIDDWIVWALRENMPTELISFAQFRPQLINNFQPTRDIINSPSPRTVEYVGRMQMNNIPQSIFYEAVEGACGRAFAIEYTAFLKVYMSLPTIHEIIMNPTGTRVPEEVSCQYALMGMIAEKMTDTTIGALITYLQRMPKELNVACLKQATIKNQSICKTREFITWASQNANLFI